MLSLQVHLLPGWSDVTAHNPDGGPTYIRHVHGMDNPLQVSYSMYRSGDIPNPSEGDLITLAQGLSQAIEPAELISTMSGPCTFGHFGSAVFCSPVFPRAQSWCLSNGKDVIRATHICGSLPAAEEIREAEWIVRRLTLTISEGTRQSA